MNNEHRPLPNPASPSFLLQLLSKEPAHYLMDLSDDGPAYWVTAPELVTAVLHAPATVLAKSTARDSLRPLLGDGTAASYFPAKQSGCDNSAVDSLDNFRLHKRQAFEPFIQKATQELLTGGMAQMVAEETANWESGQTIDIYATLHDLMLNVAFFYLFQKPVTPEIRSANRIIRETASLVARYVRSPFQKAMPYYDRGTHLLPHWQRPTGPATLALFQRRTAIESLVDSISSDTGAEADNQQGGGGAITTDIVRSLSGTPHYFQLQQRSALAGLMLASYENSAATAAWTLGALSSHCKVQESVVAEISSAQSKRRRARFDTWPLLRACVQESLRLYPPVWSIARDVKRAWQLGNDLHLEAGAVVLVSPWVQHRHPKLWNDAEQLKPQRFLDNAAQESGRYCPFGSGARACVGESFARMTLLCGLTELLRQWHFTNGERTNTSRPAFGLTLRPDKNVFLQINRR